MLTKDDVAIMRKLIREEVGNEARSTRETLQADIIHSRMEIQSDIIEVIDRVKNLEIRTANVENSINRMHRDLKKEIKTVSHFLDKGNIETSKRVDRIESHLGLTTSL